MEYLVKVNQCTKIKLKEGDAILYNYKGTNKKFKFIRADKTGKFVNILTGEGEALWLNATDISDWAGRATYRDYKIEKLDMSAFKEGPHV